VGWKAEGVSQKAHGAFQSWPLLLKEKGERRDAGSGGSPTEVSDLRRLGIQKHGENLEKAPTRKVTRGDKGGAKKRKGGRPGTKSKAQDYVTRSGFAEFGRDWTPCMGGVYRRPKRGGEP